MFYKCSNLIIWNIKGTKSTGKAGQKLLQKQLGLRRIRSFHDDFDLADFAAIDALDIYKKAHLILAEVSWFTCMFFKQLSLTVIILGHGLRAFIGMRDRDGLR